MSQPTILKLKVSKTGHASITFRKKKLCPDITCVTGGNMCSMWYRWQHVLHVSQVAACVTCVTGGNMCYRWQQVLHVLQVATGNPHYPAKSFLFSQIFTDLIILRNKTNYTKHFRTPLTVQNYHNYYMIADNEAAGGLQMNYLL